MNKQYVDRDAIRVLIERIGALRKSLTDANESFKKTVQDKLAQLEDRLNNIPEPDLTSIETAISALEEVAANAVQYTAFGGNRKTIQLDNHDTISGLDTKGVGHNLIMLSRWDKTDVGSTGTELNLNGKAARPTYNDTEEIALLKDVTGGVDLTDIEAQLSSIDAALAVAKSDITSLQANKANKDHNHAIANISGLQAALDAKADKTELVPVDDFNQLQEQYTTLQGQYSALQEQYTTLQGQYTTLNSEVAALSASLQVVLSASDVDSMFAE